MQNATAVPRDGGSGVPAVRNLDARRKLLVVLVVGSAALFSAHRALLLWCYAIIAALWLLSGEARRALGFVAVLAAVALAEWGAGFIPNATVAGMVGFLFFIFARSLSTFALIMWLSVGLRIDDLIASLQRLRLPRGLVITIAVVFRYLPTAADEFRKISATMRPVSYTHLRRGGVRRRRAPARTAGAHRAPRRGDAGPAQPVLHGDGG